MVNYNRLAGKLIEDLAVFQDKRMNNYNIHFKYIYYFLSF